MNTNKCPECGFELPEGDFCPECRVRRKKICARFI
jgi:rubredoxin|tara:strand:+ start:172 stop:276 length:105 start_codon:yes stop_codon:yes gene_type:complete